MKLLHATVACLAGAGLAWFGATRVWSVEVVTRPGLPELRTPTTGVNVQPWLLALAVIALAAAGALLATRGRVRRGLGVLIMVVGAGLVVAAITGRASVDAGDAGFGATAWPVACVVGGLLVVLAGWGALRHGGGWPVMGTRYERHPVTDDAREAGQSAAATGEGRPAAAGEGRPAAGEGRSAAGGAEHAAAGGSDQAAAGGAGHSAAGDRGADGRGATGQGGLSDAAPKRTGSRAADNRAFWDALDRGDDPTTGRE